MIINKFLCTLATVLFLVTSCQVQEEEVFSSVQDKANYAVPTSDVEKLATRLHLTGASSYSGRVEGNKKVKKMKTLRESGDSYAHIVNYDDGFWVMSADFRVAPVMAVSDNGEFDETNAPDAVKAWLEESVENIKEAKKGKKKPRKTAIMAWIQYYKDAGMEVPPMLLNLLQEAVDETGANNGRTEREDPIDPDCTSTTTTKGPLLQTSWGQGCGYNGMIPVVTNIYNDCNRASTGCVPTAMGQIMKYWQYPTSYNWSAMPNSASRNSPSSTIAQLLLDIGTLTNTQYNVDGNGLSITQNKSIDTGFIWAGYSSAKHDDTYYFNDYSRVVNEINAGRPVILGGTHESNGRIGHAWVCDGYKRTIFPCWGSTLLFHMNWGWNPRIDGSSYNGWYAYNNWYLPETSETYSRHYRFCKEIIYDIHP